MDKKRQMKRGKAALEKTCGNYKSTIIKTYILCIKLELQISNRSLQS